MDTEYKPRRVSVFQEVGLDDDSTAAVPDVLSKTSAREQKVRQYARAPSVDSIQEEELEDENSAESNQWTTDDEDEEDHKLASEQSVSDPITKPSSSRHFLTRHTLLFGLILLLIHMSMSNSPSKSILPQVKGASVKVEKSHLQKRASSPTDVCKRWSQQSALVNGTLYLYGGRATTSSSQTSDTWNNNFVTVDLKKAWQISAPPLSGLEQPSGPPAVANGYLWHSYDSLFLYGGEYSDTPPKAPDPFSLWDYSIKSSSWKKHDNSKSQDGVNSEPGGQDIRRAAEGAGFSVPALGRGWYFGGHLDAFTSPSWSISTERLYLKSFVEYTFPGYSNNGVTSLAGGQIAGSDGAWRNITNGGIQETNGFTERADGLLVYVPGFSDSGMLLSLAGGTNISFTQMNVIDVYDIANSTWYRQATSGPTPQIRVNPCAVVAAAADGSSYQIYMFGGQNLIPYGSQIQYSDMWILSIPSFTWIQVNTTSQSTPYPRAGHTCDVWDAQMVVVGGYVGQDISCESPGIYVFNLSSLEWQQSFTPLQGGGSSGSNPFSQQLSQRGADGKAGLHGSYGYAVPKAVYDVIGGKETGGATITAPVNLATAGPLATGKPITYTVTGPSGGVITATGSASSSSESQNKGTNVGAAVAGSFAGILAIVAGYCAFCALLYRKQIAMYKRHMAIAAAGQDDMTYTHGAGIGYQEGPEQTHSNRLTAFLFGGGAAYHAHTSRKESTEGSTSRNSGPNSGIYNIHSNEGRMSGTYRNGYVPGHHVTGSAGDAAWLNEGPSSPHGSQEDLMSGFEPSYWGVLLHPRRSLRVINR